VSDLEHLQIGDVVAIRDEDCTAATILEFEDGTPDGTGYGTGAIVQLANGDKVGAGFVQMSHARRFVAGERRPWQHVTDPRIQQG
jgi:hypothetical protein